MRILKNAKNPAILLSFGKDSLLVLRMALESGFTGPCFYFGDTLSPLAQQTIIDNDLTVYSWPATNRYVIPSGDGWAQVDEYLIGNVLIPLVSPIVVGEQCEHMQFTHRFARSFTYPHDVTLTGYKRSDWSDAVGMRFPREVDIGVTRFVHPLYDWTDEEVVEVLGFTPLESNAVEYCEECLAIINSLDWDKDAALASFRGRFQFHKEGDSQ